MQALQLQPLNEVSLVETPKPEAIPDTAILRMEAAALNRRDQWIREGKYPGIQPHITLGSDGCGVVEAVGSEADSHWIGQTVIVNPNVDWGSDANCQAANYSILGNPTHGTFAQYLCVPTHRLHTKPASLSAQEAAALPLGGLTAYRAVCVRAAVTASDTVLITGFGGGVAQFAFQFAVATGAKVFVTSGSEEKLAMAMRMGAAGGANYKKDDWAKQLMGASGGFSAVIDSAGGAQFNSLIRLMKRGGRLVTYGATLGRPTDFDIHRLFFYQINLMGSTMGNDQEFAEMLNFVGKHNIRPIISAVYPFKNIMEAFDCMKAGEQFGKLVVNSQL